MSSVSRTGVDRSIKASQSSPHSLSSLSTSDPTTCDAPRTAGRSGLRVESLLSCLHGVCTPVEEKDSVSQISKCVVRTKVGNNIDKVTGGGAHLDMGVQRRLLGSGDPEQKTAL